MEERKTLVGFDRNLIAPGALTAIQRLVRLLDQPGKIRRLLTLESGDPKASRH
jgi:hypothetical protein